MDGILKSSNGGKKMNLEKMLMNCVVRHLTTRGGNKAVDQLVTSFKNEEGTRTELVKFQSYKSMILMINYKTHTMTFGDDWDYSRTTSKYLHQFLLEELRLNLTTQEIRKALETGKLETPHQIWTVKGE